MSAEKIIRQLIREIIEEDYRFQYNNKLFYPNQQTIETSQQAIDAVSKMKLVGKGEAEGSGLRKAYAIIRKDGMNHGQLKRMKAFFDNNYNSYKLELSKGKNINNSGIVQKWNLWGGDAGYAWVSNMIKSHKSKNQNSKDNRPKGHKNMMDPYNTRTRTALSLTKNKLKESYIDSKGNLVGFDPDYEQKPEENKFERLIKKWDAGGRIVGNSAYEYWFPIEAKKDLFSIGIQPSDYYIDIATENPWKGQKFIVYVANPKDWD